MKQIKKISTGIITASLLAIQFVHPVHGAFADASKHEQTKKNSPFKQDKSAWDRSSLSFIGQTIISDGIKAIVKNGDDSRAMKGEVTYEVFWSASGNPKNGELVASGIINPLQPGATQILSYSPDQLVPGNYMFKAYQRPSHPGAGVLWSKSITVKETADSNEKIEPQRPLDQFFHSNVEGGTATFTVPESMGKVQISFSSYAYPEGVVPQEDGKPYENQTIYDNVSNVYGPGTYTVHVDLPENGYWQTDLYLGPVIEKLTASGHPMDKIIDADFVPAN